MPETSVPAMAAQWEDRATLCAQQAEWVRELAAAHNNERALRLCKHHGRPGKSFDLLLLLFDCAEQFAR
jgi:hypothetical protein